MFKIFTDTSANLDTSLTKEMDIGVVPMTFFIDGCPNECLDTETFDHEDYYQKMREGLRPTTSLVAPQRYIDHFEPVLKNGQDILHVAMSSGISGSYASALAAKTHLLIKYPERSIRLIDTLGASLGEGLLVLKAVEYRDKNMSLDETANALNGLKANMYQIFTVDDLNFLKSTGRLSAIKAAMGTILNMKPILKGDKNGKIVCTSTVRGRIRALKSIAEDYNKKALLPEAQTVGIAHAGCLKDAELLASYIKKDRPPAKIMTVNYEPVTGSHVGPGTLALFFFGDDGIREGI